MIIGKWNKSVILTYIGLIISILGIYLSFTNNNILLALSCLLVAGVCDLFDGAIARRCKRTKEEKQFGIELDSLVDVVNFIALPIALLINLGLIEIYHLIIYMFFAIAGVARLAYFNITLEEKNKNEPVKYYHGLPVTFIAMILPISHLLTYLFHINDYSIYYAIILSVTSLLNVLNINIRKPHGLAYPILLLMAIVTLILFLGVL